MKSKQNLASFGTACEKTFSLDKHKNVSNMEIRCIQNILEIMANRKNP
jgi:hypothetical protein